MRNPIDVLSSLKTKSCNESYHYERLYRNLYNPEFYLLAYQKMYAKEGNMTAGTDGRTIDGMGMDRINRLIDSLQNHSYQPNPARRKYIEKKGKSKKKRPLGIPSFEDKLVQEVVRMILESIYEPTFLNSSHGFRPNKSCHTALLQIQTNFTGVKWFIEGDIKGFFDNIDHQTLVNIMRKRIVDEYFIALIWKFLKAGYVEDCVFHNTYSGTPQGSIISPILSNIYLNEFDRYMQRYIEDFKKGRKRVKSDNYTDLEQKLKYLRYEKLSENKWNKMTDHEKVEAVDSIREIRNKMLTTEYSNSQDDGYRRLFYVRYEYLWMLEQKLNAQNSKYGTSINANDLLKPYYDLMFNGSKVTPNESTLAQARKDIAKLIESLDSSIAGIAKITNKFGYNNTVSYEVYAPTGVTVKVNGTTLTGGVAVTGGVKYSKTYTLSSKSNNMTFEYSKAGNTTVNYTLFVGGSVKNLFVFNTSTDISNVIPFDARDFSSTDNITTLQHDTTVARNTSTSFITEGSGSLKITVNGCSQLDSAYRPYVKCNVTGTTSIVDYQFIEFDVFNDSTYPAMVYLKIGDASGIEDFYGEIITEKSKKHVKIAIPIQGIINRASVTNFRLGFDNLTSGVTATEMYIDNFFAS